MFSLESHNLKNIPSVAHRFYGRHGGTSPSPWDTLNTSYNVGDVTGRVDENRARICFEFDVPVENLYTAQQVHGNKVIQIINNMSSTLCKTIEADALITDRLGIALGIQTADCAPILISSKIGNVIGAIHAGWRGCSVNIIAETIKAMTDLARCDASHLIAAVGPCVSQQSYEVGSEVIEAVRHIPNHEAFLQLGNNGKAHLSIASWAHMQLRNAGISNIQIIQKCTVLDNRDFFSSRAQNKHCGRQLSVIAKSMQK